MAKRHPAARRARHEVSHDPDDVFLARILQISEWAKRNQQLVVIGLVLVGILAAGIVYYRNFQAQRTQQAAQQLEAIHQSLAMQDVEGAKSELATFLEQYGGTPYEPEARLLLGELYLRTDDDQQARVVLEPIGASPREPIEFQAAMLLAAAYEQEGRWEDAVEVYLRVADRSELNFQVRDALAAAARIRADQLGDAAGAIELYERALNTLEENDPVRGLIEMRIAELRTAQSS